MRKISQIVALLVLVSFAWTQTTGKIRGTVSSSDGQALAGANVTLDTRAVLSPTFRFWFMEPDHLTLA